MTRIRIFPFKREHGLSLVPPNEITDDFKMSMQINEAFGGGRTAFINGEVLCAGGVNPLWLGTCEAWLVPSPLVKRYPVAFHRLITRELFPMIAQYDRVQVLVDSNNEVNVRWAERLGFEKEGVLRKFRGGKDYAVYSKVRGV